jgi:hypothetical protein
VSFVLRSILNRVKLGKMSTDDRSSIRFRNAELTFCEICCQIATEFIKMGYDSRINRWNCWFIFPCGGRKRSLYGSRISVRRWLASDCALAAGLAFLGGAAKRVRCDGDSHVLGQSHSKTLWDKQ